MAVQRKAAGSPKASAPDGSAHAIAADRRGSAATSTTAGDATAVDSSGTGASA